MLRNYRLIAYMLWLCEGLKDVCMVIGITNGFKSNKNRNEELERKCGLFPSYHE